jgi:FixJ family two-component response regulator
VDPFARARSDGKSGWGLVLDVRMPGLSGLDLQKRLNEAGVAIPIIFITGHGDIPMGVHAIKAGALEFLTKPFREQDLLDAIQQALDRDCVAREERMAMEALQQRFASLTGISLRFLPLGSGTWK